jgi:hypothetical protein
MTVVARPLTLIASSRPEAATPAKATLGEAGQQPPEHLPNEPLPTPQPTDGADPVAAIPTLPSNSQQVISMVSSTLASRVIAGPKRSSLHGMAQLGNRNAEPASALTVHRSHTDSMIRRPRPHWSPAGCRVR